MLFFGKRKSAPLVQSSTEDWRKQWQDLVPPECRNVPVTVDGKTMTAYVQINHFVMMLQDGLLMQQGFFDVCAHFQRAGYHVIWLVRCTQDIAGGYLKLRKASGNECLWKWRKPTTNFGRWTSDNRYVTILLQYKPAPDGDLSRCTEHILQRVQWAESNDNSKWSRGVQSSLPSARRARPRSCPTGCTAASCRPSFDRPLTYLSNRGNANAQNFVASDDLAANR